MAYDPTELRLFKIVSKTTALLISALLSLVVFFLSWGYLLAYQNTKDLVPTQMGVGAFYSGDLGDPLGIAQFRISSEAAERLRTSPSRFFAEIGDADEWKPTPAPVEKLSLGGDCATFWCTDTAADHNAERWLRRPGSFYRRWGGSSEFLLVVNPGEKQLIVGYFYV